MNIYNIKVGSIHETSGLSLNIYLSGCLGHCSGCHSQHTWDFKSGSELIVSELIEYIQSVPNYKFDHICVLGGEPLDQPLNDLHDLLSELRCKIGKPLWLYTSYEKHEIPTNILMLLDYLKTGKYIPNTPNAQKQYGVYLASNNQKIYERKDLL